MAKRRSYLKIAGEELRAAKEPGAVVAVDSRMLFGPENVEAAERWANKYHYNYDDLGDMLLQWALDGSAGSTEPVGPDIDSSVYEIRR